MKRKFQSEVLGIERIAAAMERKIDLFLDTELRQLSITEGELTEMERYAERWLSDDFSNRFSKLAEEVRRAGLVQP